MIHTYEPTPKPRNKPIAVPPWRNAYYVTTSIPVGEVLSFFALPHVLAPCWYETKFRRDRGRKCLASKIGHTDFYTVSENFRKERVKPAPPIEILMPMILNRRPPIARKCVLVRISTSLSLGEASLSTDEVNSKLGSVSQFGF